jgi:hypothetical protein
VKFSKPELHRLGNENAAAILMDRGAIEIGHDRPRRAEARGPQKVPELAIDVLLAGVCRHRYTSL